MDKTTLTVLLLALAGGAAILAIPGGAVISGNTGRKLSFVDLLALAQQAGFQGTDSVFAAAIALAESRGDPMAYNPERAAEGGTPEGKGSYGLWQIYLKAHPEYEGVNLYDVNRNAAAAFEIYQKRGQSFLDWSTFKNGAYASLIPAGF